MVTLLNRYFSLRSLYGDSTWNCATYESTLRITTSEDSGVLVMAYIDSQVNQYPFHIEQEDIPILRKHYSLAIINECMEYRRPI
jgi:hypothetical protein